MAVITTGSNPKSLLPGDMGNVTTQADPKEPLYPSVAGRFTPPPRKPPKIKKKAFGDKHPGAAFRK